MSLNARDSYLQNIVPTVIVPKYEPLPEMTDNGHRILMAANGVFLEVRRSWLHLVHQIAPIEALTLPYGMVEPSIKMLFAFPTALVRLFYQDSLGAYPKECGGMIVRNADGAFRYQTLETLQASGEHLKAAIPELAEGEELVVDLHSHGMHRAGFSPLDDIDDKGEFKIAGVIGSLDKERTPTTAFRLCAGGVFIPLSVDAAAVCN